MKKRKDGRYMAQRKIDGTLRSFYGKTPREVYAKIAEAEKKAKAPATFKEIADEWYDAKWDTFSPGTQSCYRSSLERALSEFDGLDAAEVTPALVSRLIDRLIMEKYSGKTVKTQKTVISTIYRFAMVNGKASSNPASPVAIPRGLPKKQRTPPSDEDIRKVIETNDPWIFPRLLLYTGMRRGEALALTYEDIDFDNKTIRINKEILFRSNTPIFVDHTKTSAGNRTVVLPDALAALIPKNKKGLIFETSYRRFKTEWDHYCNRVGVNFTPHQLRHAYATFLFDAGVQAKDAQPLLGHADISTTQNVYTHIMQRRNSETAAKVNDYFNNLTKKS